MNDPLSVNDLFLIFNKPLESTRYIRAADNDEDTGIVVYIVQRNQRELVP